LAVAPIDWKGHLGAGFSWENRPGGWAQIMSPLNVLWSWAWWHTLVIPVTEGAEPGGSKIPQTPRLLQ
uniref:Uncharacterized protein n=1 Tax=Spermophilus dauricus TaxID=99837 RepID=A0A8C9QRR7_SPEDA